jgi:adenylylsulfate kinase
LLARKRFREEDFIEVFCDANLDTCEKRDVKGLYQRARNGDIADFTGISSPYEAPVNPELRVPTGELSLDASVSMILDFLRTRGIISDKPKDHD